MVEKDDQAYGETNSSEKENSQVDNNRIDIPNNDILRKPSAASNNESHSKIELGIEFQDSKEVQE